jgi:ATP-dependent DNA helicase DinG
VCITGHVRTRTDHGTGVCLDLRIVTKPYGKLFLESLPECDRVEPRFGLPLEHKTS